MKIVELHTPLEGLHVEYLAEQHHEEFGTSREFSRQGVTQACLRCVMDKERKRMNCWIAYDDDDSPVGYLAATLNRSFYSLRDYAVQEMWFVVRTHRGSRASIDLLRSFEKWATRHDAERIYTQVEHDTDTRLVERILLLMQRMGYRKAGYIAVKVLGNKHKDEDNDRSTHRGVGANEAQQQ
jgi:hypothetical protein